MILPPTTEVLGLTAEAFWAILRDEVCPTRMIEGTSFNFGKGRGGTIEKLKEWAAVSPVRLEIIDPVSLSLVNLNVRSGEQFAGAMVAGARACSGCGHLSGSRL